TQFALAAASLFGLLGVVLGAFGAHALSARLGTDMQAIWQRAVEYQFYHALALLAVGILLRTDLGNSWMTAATLCFCLGTLIFSGSLYILALSGIRWLGTITPLGGLLLIAGWAALLGAVLRGS